MDQSTSTYRDEVLKLLLRDLHDGIAPEQHTQRFTQDSPVLSDVWLSFASKPDGLEEPRNLLINPYMGQRAGLVALELRTVTQILRSREQGGKAEPAPVAHLPGLVAASLTFSEMLRVALPSTLWWHKTVAQVADGLGINPADVVPDGLMAHQDKVVDWMVGNTPSEDWDFEADRARREFMRLIEVVGAILNLHRFHRAAKTVAPSPGDHALAMTDEQAPPSDEERQRDLENALGDARAIARRRLWAFCKAYENWTEQPSRALVWSIALNRNAKLTGRDSRLSIKADAGKLLFHISCSHLTWAVIDSGIDIRSPAFRDWGARPPSAQERRPPDRSGELDVAEQIAQALRIERPYTIRSQDATRRTVLRDAPERDDWPTRLVARYDFTDIMRLLDISVAKAMRDRLRKLDADLKKVEKEMREATINAPAEQDFWDRLDNWATRDQATKARGAGATLSQLENRGVSAQWMSRILQRLVETACVKIGRVQRDTIAARVVEANPKEAAAGRHIEGLTAIARWRLFRMGVESAGKQVEGLINRLELGLELDWSILEEFLIDMTPDTPSSPHGTQVASVLAADWRDPPKGLDRRDYEDGQFEQIPAADFESRFQGVCPDIRLMDLRVSDEAGNAQEFEAIAALQFILHLNTRSTEKAIHGANISLSIPHDVRNYGCGQTRICEACEQLVASGVVVVAPAGNGGTVLYETSGGAEFSGFQAGSITDPGNAESIITVGATHAVKPHQYGVSYFSSRGPTGDGRMKPDLVAPGEKIQTAGMGHSVSIVDGTSFAAPHVSGAAALLMARYSELIGQPERIKQLLCETATDLGRDRNFQGAGMLDALRALQAM